MSAVFFDSHAHIDTDAFDGDRDQILARARAAGVREIVVIGATGGLAEAERAIDLADGDPELYATVGVHPHDVAAMYDTLAEQPDWWDRFDALAARDGVVGIGETGLDYYYDNSPRDLQQRAFAAFIERARDHGKPVICHIRDAHDDAREILTAHGAGELPCVIHCFTGSPDDAAAYVDLGCYVSFSGIVTFKGAKSDPIREAVRRVPRDRLLIETDCPYLAPQPYRGKRNEPAYVVHTAEVVAREAGLSVAELAAQTTANARTFFSLTG
jgi:TatD DNase family protein